MTDEKAIEILEECWRYSRTDKYTDDEIRQAIEKAIYYIKCNNDLYDLGYNSGYTDAMNDIAESR